MLRRSFRRITACRTPSTRRSSRWRISSTRRTTHHVGERRCLFLSSFSVCGLSSSVMPSSLRHWPHRSTTNQIGLRLIWRTTLHRWFGGPNTRYVTKRWSFWTRRWQSERVVLGILRWRSSHWFQFRRRLFSLLSQVLRTTRSGFRLGQITSFARSEKCHVNRDLCNFGQLTHLFLEIRWFTTLKDGT